MDVELEASEGLGLLGEVFWEFAIVVAIVSPVFISALAFAIIFSIISKLLGSPSFSYTIGAASTGALSAFVALIGAGVLDGVFSMIASVSIPAGIIAFLFGKDGFANRFHGSRLVVAMCAGSFALTYITNLIYLSRMERFFGESIRSGPL